MKKAASVIFIIVILLALASCSGSNITFDKASVVSKAEKVVEVINTKDYTSVTKVLREDLQSKVSADSLKAAWDSQLTNAGSFVGYKSETASAVKQNGSDYIVVVLVCKYENSTLTYTISFDTDLNVAGLYMK
jgi:hypothetical protein